MREYLTLFVRAWLIVSLTAANAVFVVRGAWLPMFVTGMALSWVWWLNTRTAARSDLRGAGLLYALGAGMGTLTGAALARCF
jgi:hypothetical protein